MTWLLLTTEHTVCCLCSDGALWVFILGTKSSWADVTFHQLKSKCADCCSVVIIYAVMRLKASPQPPRACVRLMLSKKPTPPFFQSCS